MTPVDDFISLINQKDADKFEEGEIEKPPPRICVLCVKMFLSILLLLNILAVLFELWKLTIFKICTFIICHKNSATDTISFLRVQLV